MIDHAHNVSYDDVKDIMLYRHIKLNKSLGYEWRSGDFNCSLCGFTTSVKSTDNNTTDEIEFKRSFGGSFEGSIYVL